MWRTKSSVFRQSDRRLCGPRTMIRENGRMKVMIMYSSEIQDGDRRWPTVTTFVAISKLQRVKPQDLKGALECVHTWLPKNGLKLWISEWYLWIILDRHFRGLLSPDVVNRGLRFVEELAAAYAPFVAQTAQVVGGCQDGRRCGGSGRISMCSMEIQYPSIP